jgi:mannitol 2-dehydrogenase
MQAQLPAYDRSKLTPASSISGWATSTAHMAVYLDDLFAKELSPRLGDPRRRGARGRRRMRDALKGQDCLSTVIELDPKGKSARRIGSMIDFLPVEPDNAALIAAMARPEIRIVSLTVTEGGYFINPATGQFDPAPRDRGRRREPAPHRLRRDHRRPEGARRREVPPFTVMSCDNLPGNGHVTQNAVIGLARLSDPALADWIKANVAFPNGMVDRITPATGRASARWRQASAWATTRSR